MQRVWILCLIGIVLSGAVYAKKIDAKEALQKLKSDPKNTFLLSIVAREFEKEKDYLKASKIYAQCIEIEPENSRHYVSLARTYSKNGEFALAKSVLNGALKYFPDNAYIHGEMGNIEMKLGEYRAAITAYEKTLRLMEGERASKKAFYYTQLGKCYREEKDYTKASVYFQQSLKAKEDFWGYYEYGKLLDLQQKYSDAIWAFKRAKAYAYSVSESLHQTATRKLAASYYNLGIKLKTAGKNTEAKAQFKIIINDNELKKTSYGEKANFWYQRL